MTRGCRYLVAMVAAMSCVMFAFAESPTFDARFSKDTIEVGDRVEYIIEIDKDRVTQIGLPDFDGNPTPEELKALKEQKRRMSGYEEFDEDIFELVAEQPIDTLEVDGRRLRLQKRYELAVMTTGHIPFRPAILYFDKNRDVPDTLYGRDTLYINVVPYVEIDTTLFLRPDPMSQDGFGVDDERARAMLKDEGVYSHKNLPFIFAEIRDYVIYGIIGVVILALLVWLAVWYMRKMLAARTVVKIAKQIPPHIVANMALIELNNRKLWQNGKFKLYYTTLTSILRSYIAGRWGVGAMEMTTDEIVEAMKSVDLSFDSRNALIQILRTADMVKFAKAQPDAEENEECFRGAYYFVENTKPQLEELNEEKRDINHETKIGD